MFELDDKIVVVAGIIIVCITSIWLPNSNVPEMAISALAGIATGKALSKGD